MFRTLWGDRSDSPADGPPRRPGRRSSDQRVALGAIAQGRGERAADELPAKVEKSRGAEEGCHTCCRARRRRGPTFEHSSRACGSAAVVAPP